MNFIMDIKLVSLKMFDLRCKVDSYEGMATENLIALVSYKVSASLGQVSAQMGVHSLDICDYFAN